MENTRLNNLIKFVLVVAIIAIVVIYPILHIEIPSFVVNGFGALITYLLGVSTNLGNNDNG